MRSIPPRWGNLALAPLALLSTGCEELLSLHAFYGRMIARFVLDPKAYDDEVVFKRST